MSYLVQELIKAHTEKKPIHLGPLKGSAFKALLNELAVVRQRGKQ